MEKKVARAPFFPSWRLSMAVLQLLMTIVLYANRVNISFAIVCMTSPIGGNWNISSSLNETSESLPLVSAILQTAFSRTSLRASSDHEGDQPIRGIGSLAIYSTAASCVSFQEESEFEWNSKLRGLILGSFSIGAVITQIPFGWLAHRSNAKWLLVGGVAVMTIASFLSPVAARWGWGCLVAIQIVKGLASGPFYPSSHQILATWSPPDERSRMVAISLAGSTLGSVIGFLSAGWLCTHGFAGGWPSIFYTSGILAFPVMIAWVVLVSDDPMKHQFVSETEKQYIADQVKHEISYHQQTAVPWRSVMTSLPIYAIYFADVAACWLWFTAQTSLPTYFNDVLKMEITTNGALNSLPYLAHFVVSLLSSWAADMAIKINLPKTRIRKASTSIALITVSILVIAVGFLGNHQQTEAVALLTLAVGLLGFTRAGHLSNQLEVAPRFSAIVVAINNTICLTTAVIAPVVTGYLTPNGTQEEWRVVFFITSGISLFGAAFYAIFASAEVQEWAKVKTETIHENIPLKETGLSIENEENGMTSNSTN